MNKEERKGKTYEEIYGIDRVEGIKLRQSESLKKWHRDNKNTPEYKKIYNNRKNNRIKINCLYCDKEFFDYPSNKRKFCSKSCSVEFRDFTGKNNPFYGKTHSEKTKGIMSIIHKGFHPQKEFKRGHQSWNYIDGRSKLVRPALYGDDWDKIRYLVYKRDKFICQSCGEFGIRLHVHHKIPFMISFDNSLNNLITLCPSCHRKEEARIIKELKQSIQIEVNSIGGES